MNCVKFEYISDDDITLNCVVSKEYGRNKVVRACVENSHVNIVELLSDDVICDIECSAPPFIG